MILNFNIISETLINILSKTRKGCVHLRISFMNSPNIILLFLSGDKNDVLWYIETKDKFCSFGVFFVLFFWGGGVGLIL